MNINEIKAAVDAARERRETLNDDEILSRPFCGSENLYLNFVNRDEDACYRECSDCEVSSGLFDSQKLTDEHWNTRPAQQEADDALIALWKMTQIDESVFETAERVISEPAYHSSDAALLARSIMRVKEPTDAAEI